MIRCLRLGKNVEEILVWAGVQLTRVLTQRQMIGSNTQGAEFYVLQDFNILFNMEFKLDDERCINTTFGFGYGNGVAMYAVILE